MKHLFYTVLILISVSISCNSEQTNQQLIAPLALGTENNPLAGIEYQQMRLQNPITKKIPSDIFKREFEFVQNMNYPKSASNNQWFQRGPVNVGGRTRALALDIDNENRILAGGVSGGLWISENGGDSFTKATTSLMLHSVTCIAQDKRPAFRNTWYYGTGELSGNSADLVGHGIYTSSDGGLTWSLLPSTANDVANQVSSLGDFSYVSDIVVHPTSGQIVASTFPGIFVSDDNGNSWSNVLTADNSPNGFGYVNFGNQTSIYCTDNGVYYAGLSSDAQDEGIYRSIDGVNWTNITPSGFSNSYRRIEMAAAPSNNDVVYFVVDASIDPFTDNHEFWKYSYISGDGTGAGGSWEDRSNNLPNGQCTGFYDFDFGYYQTQSSYDMCIAVHPTNENIVFIGGTNLYRSMDGFASSSGEWIGGYQCDTQNPSNYIWPNHHPDNHYLIFLPSNPNVLISAHDGGLSKTTTCLAPTFEWTSLNNGYGTTQFYTLAIEPGATNSDFIIGGLQDNGTWLTNSPNPNEVWSSVFYGDGAYCAIEEGRGSYYVSWQGGKTFKFDIDDNGNTLGLTRIDPPNVDDYLFINPFILDPTNAQTMYLAGGQDIYVNDSLNHIQLQNDEYNPLSLGWDKIDESNITPGIPGAFLPRISTLDMSEADNSVLYYGSSTGGLFRLNGLNTGSITRTNIKENIMPSSAYVSCIEVNSLNANEVMTTFSNYEVESIFYSENAGDDWVNVSGNLEENPDGSGAGPSINWAHIYDDGVEKRFYVGTTSGLFSTETLDGGNTVWTREGEESIGNVPVSMISSRVFDGTIAVATHGNGIFSNKEFVSSLNDVGVKQQGVYMSQPYPNPIQGAAKFEVRSEAETALHISLIDLSGKQIEVIFSSEKFVGNKELKWYPNASTKGHFFIVAQFGSEQQVRKVVVI